MMPLLAFLRIRGRSNRGFRLWIPLFLIWLLLLPLVLVISPFAFIACLAGQVNPFRAFAVLWQVLAGLRNTHVEITQGPTLVLIRVL